MSIHILNVGLLAQTIENQTSRPEKENSNTNPEISVEPSQMLINNTLKEPAVTGTHQINDLKGYFLT